MRASLDAMRRRGEVVSVLYPQVTRLYRALGWEVAGTVVFRQLAPRVLQALPRSELPVRRLREADRAAVRAAYDRVARATNGFVERRDGRWAWIFERFAEDEFFVAGDQGYVLYRVVDKPPAGPEGFRLLVLDHLATTPEAWRALWGLLAHASSVVPTLFFRGGPHDPLALALETQDLVITRERPWMLRLVDAPAAIAARGYGESAAASVALEIADETCPWNAGRHTLVVRDGSGRLEPGGAGTVRLGIGTLAALYSGHATTATRALGSSRAAARRSTPRSTASSPVPRPG